MAVQQVLIEFNSDPTGLQPAEKALNGLTEGEKKLADQAGKTNSQLETGNKSLASSIDKLAAASKSLDKSIIAGAYKAYLKELQAQLGLTSKELITYVQNARKAAQEAIFSAESQDEIDALQLSIEAMNETLVTLQENEKKTAESTNYLRTRLQEAKEEFAGLIANGITSGPVFDAAKDKLSELSTQMRNVNEATKNLGSDTRSLDALISLAGGVAGGFAVAEGAMALFGSENEDVHKALLKVNAAMAILQGLQSFQNILQKESAAMLLINEIRTKALAAGQLFLAATTLETAAATVTLRTALIASGIGAFVVILGLVANAMGAFGDETETTADKIERLNKEAEELYDSLQKISKINQAEVNRNIAIAQNKTIIDQLTAEGASVEKINTLKKESIVLENKNLQQELLNIQAAKQRADDKDMFVERELAVRLKIYENTKQQLLLDIETNKVLAERAFKSASGFADAEVAKKKLAILNNQVDSIASIEAVTDAEIKAIKIKRDEQLLSEKLTAGEIAKINADANLKIAEQQKDLRDKLLDIQMSGINAKLLLAEKGSEQEYQFKKQQIQQQQTIELAGIEVASEKEKEIKAKFRVQQLDLDRQFAEQKISNEISFLSSYIDAFGISEGRKLELTLRRLDRQRDLEISQAEGNAAKIAEINAKYDKIILDTKKASIKAELDEKIRALDAFNHISSARNAKIIADDKSSLAKKKAAIADELADEMDKIQLEEDALKDQKEKNLITEKEYSIAYQEILNKRSDAAIAAEEKTTAAVVKEIAKKLEAVKAVFNVFQNGLNEVLGKTAFTVAVTQLENFGEKVYGIFKKIKEGVKVTKDDLIGLAEAGVAAVQNIVNQIYADGVTRRAQIANDEIAMLEESKQRELSVKNLTEQQKADIEARYRQKEKIIKRQAFEADKQAKKIQAQINGALAATLALAEYAWPYSLIVAGIVEGLTQISVAEINRQQAPGFKKGGYTGDKGKNDIAGVVHGKEFVTTAEQTAKHRDALQAIHDDKFDEFLNDKFADFGYPQAPEIVNVSQDGDINYSKLAKEVAKEMRGVIPPALNVTNNIDGDGLHSFVEEGNRTVEIKNKTFSMTSNK